MEHISTTVLVTIYDSFSTFMLNIPIKIRLLSTHAKKSTRKEQGKILHVKSKSDRKSLIN